jgi:hypothetical protein
VSKMVGNLKLLLKSAKSPLKNINGNVYNYDKVKA